MAEIIFVEDGFDSRVLENCCCGLGVFDGVHRGHQYLITSLKNSAKKRGVESAVLTFDIDPDEVFRPHALTKILSNQKRIEFLGQTGVDKIVVMRFSKMLSSLTPEEFLDFIFGDTPASELHVGFDLHFGCRASGNVDDLKVWGTGVGCKICDYELFEIGGMPVSATRIRELLQRGKTAEADLLLGYSLTDLKAVG